VPVQLKSTKPSKKKFPSQTRKSSLHIPNKKTSPSDDADGPEGNGDKKRMEEHELNAVKLDIFLFWKFENFANLDGTDEVEPDDRFNCFEEEITRLPEGRYCTPTPWKTDKWRLKKNL
jgi:hypothetical protein